MLVISYIRMKTANDFIKHLEEFRSDMNDDNIQQAAVLEKDCMVMYLYTDDTNKSISDTAKKVASLASWSICQHGCLTEVNTTFHRYNKNNEEASRSELGCHD